MVRRIVVIGASLAGLRAAEALRARGFDGSLTLVGDEPHLPYDRPPLSKQVLQGAWDAARAFFRKQEGYGSLALDLRLATRAVSVDLGARHVTLDDDSLVQYERLIIATGARPRWIPSIPSVGGVHVLRTLDQALALRDEIGHARRVVIIGAGFIGLEVAASCRARGVDVTMIESFELPLPVCGPTIGSLVAATHRDHGVDLRTGATVAAIHGTARVEAVELSDGTRVAADVVVIGVGVVPATAWLEGSGLTLDGGILCDSRGEAAPGVFAAGDVARIPNGWIGDAPRIEHWSNAVEQAAFVAESALDGDSGRVFSSVPYFWSDQYDRKIQFVGLARPHDEMVVVEGSIADRQLTALFRRGDTLCACLTINQPRSLVRFRKLLAERVSWAAALAAVSGA